MRRIRLVPLLTLAALLLTATRSHAAQAEPVLTSRPLISYPAEAKAVGAVGKCIIIVSIDPATGRVTSASVGRSTGYPFLDEAARSGCLKARFQKGGPEVVQIPVTFTRGGGQIQEVVKTTGRNMDDVLAAFLGKGTVLKGPIPAYPRRPSWTHKTGKGVYELHVNKEGRVDRVRVLKSSGDAIFDREAVKTLGKWRLRRGPFVLELPLRFKLTPTNYSMDVGR